MQAQAFSMLASDDASYPISGYLMIQQLAKSSGSLGMAGGQAIDLASVNKKLNEATTHYNAYFKNRCINSSQRFNGCYRKRYE